MEMRSIWILIWLKSPISLRWFRSQSKSKSIRSRKKRSRIAVAAEIGMNVARTPEIGSIARRTARKRRERDRTLTVRKGIVRRSTENGPDLKRSIGSMIMSSKKKEKKIETDTEMAIEIEIETDSETSNASKKRTTVRR